MTKRSPGVTLLLFMFTCGIFPIIWYYTMANELRTKGIDVPSMVFLFIPFVNIWWLYRLFSGLAKASQGAVSETNLLLLVFFCAPVGIYKAQAVANQIP